MAPIYTCNNLGCDSQYNNNLVADNLFVFHMVDNTYEVLNMRTAVVVVAVDNNTFHCHEYDKQPGCELDRLYHGNNVCYDNNMVYS